MTSKEFWKCTPRKLAALSKVHADLNTPKDTKKKTAGKQQIPNSSRNGVGVPNAFIDQI